MGHILTEFDLVGGALDLPQKMSNLLHICHFSPCFFMIYVAKGAIFVGGQGHVPQGQIRILCDPEVIGSRHTESWVRLKEKWFFEYP